MTRHEKLWVRLAYFIVVTYVIIITLFMAHITIQKKEEKRVYITACMDTLQDMHKCEEMYKEKFKVD